MKLIERVVDLQGNVQVRTRCFAGPERRGVSLSPERALARAISQRFAAESHGSDRARAKPHQGH